MATKTKSAFILGILAIAVAVIFSIFLYNYLKGQEEKVKKAVATEKIVVASAQIPTGSTIKSSQLNSAEWPKANLPQGAFTSIEQVSGRRTLERIQPGEPVLEAKLVPAGGAPGVLVYKIPEGHRAMTVGVDQVAGVAGFIAPQNRVDVILTTTPPGAKQSVSKIVLQDVPVLATGQIVEQSPDGKPVIVPTVTMDVTPLDAEKLAIASTQGRLQLVLRGAGDIELAKTPGATVTKVLSGTGKPAKKGPAVRKPRKRYAAKSKTKIYVVEVWRNGSKTIETFKVEQL